MPAPKPVASLSPDLLARKGGCRLAIGSQRGPLHCIEAADAAALDDLGWNDMGRDPEGTGGAAHLVLPRKAPSPFHRSAGAQPNGLVPAGPEQLAAVRGRRVAVCLKIDPHRHLQLRLASMLSNRSAQQLVTDMLDRLLNEIPGLDTMLHRLKRNQEPA